MNNFLNFIQEDIANKKSSLSTMPIKTKTNIKNFNEKIDSFFNSYTEYKKHVKKYVKAKKKSFEVSIPKEHIEELILQIQKVEHLRFLLNPSNTFFEKMGFDNLLFDIRNYTDFNFDSINEIINKFLDKFELVGIQLSNPDFNYTYYVREYMTSFLEIRSMETKNHDLLSRIFENIYWENPDLIQHIELSFRKLIKQHKKQFQSYLKKFQEEIMAENEIYNYNDCLEKLKELYRELNKNNIERVDDIIFLVLQGKIEIKDLFKDSKVRKANYKDLMIQEIDLENPEANENFHKTLEKLKENIEEYQNLNKFNSLFKEFKNVYEKEILENDKSSFKNNKSKSLEAQINEKEMKLEKINKSIFSQDESLTKKIKKVSLQQQKADTLVLAKELYELYIKYDNEVFNEQVLLTINNYSTIPELLHLYYSYDFFKKEVIRKVFNLSSYDDVLKYSEEFDLFSMNPNNLIINGVSIFEETLISKTIINRYRLDNINIKDEDLEVDNLNNLLSKIKFLLRIYEIEKSDITMKQIWFMTEVKRLNELEK